MALGYFHNNYYHANYWHANYWSAGGSEVGDYWQSFYWHPNYWHANYWQQGSGAGDIFQTSAATLGFTVLKQTATASLNVGATTPTLALTPQNADATPDLDITVSLPSLSLTPQNTTVETDTNVYQLGDIDLRFVPGSDFTVTEGVIVTTPSIGFSIMSHTIGETGGVNVAVGVPPALTLTPFVTDSRLDIAVEPLPPSIGFTPQNTTAGSGQQIPATQPTLGFTIATHTIVATSSVGLDVDVTTPSLLFAPLSATVTAERLPTDSDGNVISEARMMVESDGIAKMDVDSTATARMRML
jgi:hypothetical protein